MTHYGKYQEETARENLLKRLEKGTVVVSARDDSTTLGFDSVNHPKHYVSHPSGIEVIEITQHMNFCLGNAVKYILRAGIKDPSKDVEDLEKAIWYIKREVERLKK